MSDDIVFKYLAKNNPDNRSVTGTPLRDLTAADLLDWPDWQIRMIENSGLYQAVKKSAPKVESKKASTDTKEGKK